MSEIVLTNARIVLPDSVVDGTLVVRDGRIEAIEDAPARAGEDMGGDWLLPGLVELHTDHLENHYAPRPGVRWNPIAAVQAHDAQVAASGITTVFDALRVGMDEDSRLGNHDMRLLADAIEAAQAGDHLRTEHFIHMRCEVSAPDAADGFRLFTADARLRLASLMDHTPGQRQFTTLDSYRIYYQDKTGMSDAAFQAFVASRQAQAGRWSDANRQAIAALCREAGLLLASHDDATEGHVAEARAHGISLAEFPTTLEAARASREAGMKVLMGAPNVVRGGSHSGNVSARALAERGLLDIPSSDYVPLSLLHAAFLIAGTVEGIGVPEAVALVSRNPAEAVRLSDRGAGRAGGLARGPAGRLSGAMDRDPTRIGPGAFVAVVGPSGAGKDTLIAYAKDRLAHRPGLVFVRRTVTRPCDAGTEEHETLTPAEFERVAAAGGFALHWTAHGHRYGLPVTLDRTIAAGGAAVANASCGMIGAIRARYERPVIVLVTARPDVLAARLAARGRESAPEVARLLRRLEDEPVAGADVVRSENDGPVERAGEAFVRTVEDALSAGRSGIARNAV